MKRIGNCDGFFLAMKQAEGENEQELMERLSLLSGRKFLQRTYLGDLRSSKTEEYILKLS